MALVRSLVRSELFSKSQSSQTEQKEATIPPDSNSLVKPDPAVTTADTTSTSVITILLDGKKLANVPTCTKHWYGETWASEAKTVPTDADQLDKFILDLQNSFLLLSTRVTSFDNLSSSMTNVVALLLALSGGINTAIGASTLSESAKSNTQIVVGAVGIGLSAVSAFYSKALQPKRDQALSLRADALELVTTLTTKPK